MVDPHVLMVPQSEYVSDFQDVFCRSRADSLKDLSDISQIERVVLLGRRGQKFLPDPIIDIEAAFN